MSGDLLTVDELANQFNCNAETVREAFRSGELVGFKFAGDWFAVRQDFMACLAERARAESQERRSKRQPGVGAPTPPAGRRQRRQAPILPAPVAH